MMSIDRFERAYFLGDLSSEEMTRLEIAVMEDEAVAERTTATEAELVDDYIDGSLAPGERQRFETVYMAVPERASRVRLSQELAERARPRRPPVVGGAKVRPLWRLLLPLAATLLAGAGVWLARNRPTELRIATTPPAPTTTPTAGSPTPGATAVPTPASVSRASFVLAIAAARGPAPAPLVIPKGTELIDFEVDLEGESRFVAFDAQVVDASGREIWRTSHDVPLRPTTAGTLVVMVPTTSGIGRSNRCDLVLEGRSAEGRATPVARIPLLFAKS